MGYESVVLKVGNNIRIIIETPSENIYAHHQIDFA
jgi:hypothetical protein